MDYLRRFGIGRNYYIKIFNGAPINWRVVQVRDPRARAAAPHQAAADLAAADLAAADLAAADLVAPHQAAADLVDLVVIHQQQQKQQQTNPPQQLQLSARQIDKQERRQL